MIIIVEYLFIIPLIFSHNFCPHQRRAKISDILNFFIYRIVLDYDVSSSDMPVPPMVDKSLLHQYDDNLVYTWLLYA